MDTAGVSLQRKDMDESIICAGFGGQGIMLMGRLLAEAAMMDKYNTTCMPSYGAEVRGGTAHSMVRISTGKIANPIVSNPDTCIIMNKPSFTRFIERINGGGLAICNSSLIDITWKRKGVKIVNIPATNIAKDLGNIRVANIVVLGAYAKARKILSIHSFMSALEEVFSKKKDLIDLNKKAFEKGVEFV